MAVPLVNKDGSDRDLDEEVGALMAIAELLPALFPVLGRKQGRVAEGEEGVEVLTGEEVDASPFPAVAPVGAAELGVLVVEEGDMPVSPVPASYFDDGSVDEHSASFSSLVRM